MKTNKIISIILLAIMFITSILPICKSLAVQVGDNVTLMGIGTVPHHLKNKAISGNGYVNTHMVGYYENGQFHPAYCMNEDRKGADNEHSYNVTLTELLANTEMYNRVWRVAVNGYPYQSLETLGVSSNEYAFQATKMAIYCVLGQSHLENFYANDDIGQSIVNLIHRLVNIGLNGTDTYKTPIASINKSGEMILDGDYYIQNYNVSCNVEVSSYSIEKVGFPNGTIITNSVGEEKTSFGQGETFQLKIPKNIVETENINGRLIAKVNAKSYALFYSTNYNPNLQDYATTADIVELTNSAVDINLKANTASIKIRKIDTDTKQPIKDTTYELIKEDGTVLSIGTTDENGELVFKELYQGNYVIKEVKANDDYVISQESVDIRANYNKVTEVTLENEHKKGDLKVYKTDADNNKIVLGGVKFALYSYEFDKITEHYTTDANGEISIKGLRTGSWALIEEETNKWYNLLDDQAELKIEWNETTNTTIENELKKSQIKIIKVDKENHEVKLENVEFEILDKDGNVLEKIKTNKEGEAVTSVYPVRDFEELYIKETVTNEKYVLDDTIHKVELKENEIVNYIFENQKIKGQIKVVKTAEEDNKITGDKKGSPITNVSFDIYDENKNYIETIKTTQDGTAISSLLEKGIYFVKENKEDIPEWYQLNENEYCAEIEKHEEIVELNITNKPDNPEVDVEKDGIIQTTANQEIKYDFVIKNTGNVPLHNFTWYDYLPIDYVKPTRLVTGTYNQDLNYAIYYKTNKNEYRLLRDNLSTKTNNYIDFSNLELEKDEYVTEFKAEFGKVDVGFTSIEKPQLFVKVKSSVKNDEIFINKTKVEGYHKTYYVYDEDDHTTKIYEKKINVKLPRTGY